MLIFSGSLMILVGLAGLVGLLARGHPPGQDAGGLEGDKPVAPEG
jgi:hypothetical protein